MLQTKSDYLCLISTLIAFAWILYLPFYTFISIYKNFKHLDLIEVKENIGYLYEGLKTDNIFNASYKGIYLTRRLVTSFLLTFMDNYPFFQVALILAMTAFENVIAISVRPYKGKEDKINSIVDESITFLFSLSYIVLTNPALDEKAFEIVSYVCISLCFVNILYHFLALLLSNVKATIEYVRKVRTRTIN